MELSRASKQTEVPREWGVAPISSLLGLPIQNGVFNEPSRKGRACKLINVIDLYGSLPLNTNELERFAASRDELARFRVKHGDIFFTRSSLTPDGIAQCNIYQGNDDDEIVFDCHIIRVRPDSTKVEPSFLVRYCASNTARRHLVASAKTTTMTTIDQSVIARLPIVLPPLPEQRAIATALGDVDALLGGLDRLIAKKRDLKQAAMQQLLTGQTRLPSFHGEWEVKQLGACLLSSPDYGINAPAVAYSDRLPTYIRITDISDNGRFSPDPRVSVQSTFADRYELNVGDVVFARTGASVGKAYRYRLEDGPLVFAGFLIRVRPNPDALISAYLAAYTTTGPYWNWVRLMSMRSGQPGINGHEYAMLPIHLPPLDEQAAIATVLSDMDVELSVLEAQRDKTSALKQGMTQELLTGKTRLVPAGVADA